MSELPDRLAHAGWWERAKYRRGRRALERQLDYQRSKAEKLGGHEEELVRVLKPGGLLFFTVNVHHPFYDLASDLHGLWNAAGLHFELSAFADHTIHLTQQRISSEFRRFPLEIVEERSSVEETRRVQR